MKVVFGLFLSIALASNITMPEHQTHKNLTYTNQVMNCFQEVNEIYDDTFKKIHHLIYSTNITTIECFTFRNAMKLEDKMSFVEATKK